MTNPFVKEVNGQLQITEAGFEHLQNLVTDPKAAVYGITGLSPVMAAAGMARLSRNPHDMRKVILKEFALGDSKDEQLLRRVITSYGDDSVQQLVGVQMVVEGASNLLTKLLEWPRLGAYLEQSTRYIYFDQRDNAGRYRYYVPDSIGDKAGYVRTMDTIFDLYSEMVRGVTEHVRKTNPRKDEPEVAWKAATRAQACDAVRPVLPVATQSTVGLFMSAQALDNLIMHLLSQDLPEAVQVGEALLNEARKIIPVFLERTDQAHRGGAKVAYMATNRRALRALAESYNLSGYLRSDRRKVSVDLLDYWPRNEREVIKRLLFSSSDYSSRSIGSFLGNLSEAELKAVLDAFVGIRLGRRLKPGRALEKAHYEWEIVGDYGTFRDLQRHRMVDAMEWQSLRPDLGFEVPDLVKEAGFSARFHDCFKLSKELYGAMEDRGESEERQYATLLGHRMRYGFITNLRELYHMLELRTGPTGHPGYRRICLMMFDRLKEVHPMLAAGMKFIGEDPDNDQELTRMASELASHDKLERLERLEAGESI